MRVPETLLGQCPKNHLVRASDGMPGSNDPCYGLKQFYAHIRRDIAEILRRVQAQKGYIRFG